MRLIMAADEDPAPCLIVIGIVMAVFDVIIIESGYLVYVGGFLIFLGIVAAIATNNQRQKAARTTIVQNQTVIQPQPVVQAPPQEVRAPSPPPEVHKFCPYCGKSTTGQFCPECGQEID